jgi:hypothetical protein
VIFGLFKRKAEIAEPTPAERLAATLRPDPEARAKRLSQWSRDRQQRYIDASYGTPHSLLRRAQVLTDRSPDLPVSAFPPVVADTGFSIQSGAGSSAARMSETGNAIPDCLDRTCGVSPAVKQARISTPMNNHERI